MRLVKNDPTTSTPEQDALDQWELVQEETETSRLELVGELYHELEELAA